MEKETKIFRQSNIGTTQNRKEPRTLKMPNEEVRGLYPLKKIQDYVDKVKPKRFKDSFDVGMDHIFIPPGEGSPSPRHARKLAEVFMARVINHTEEDLEIYGTVELSVGSIYSRYIYRRNKDDCLLVKKNEGAYLLLNGPKSVFGLDVYDFSFVAYLRDRRDDRLIHVGDFFHLPSFKQKVETIRLRHRHLSYEDESEFSPPADVEKERRFSLSLLLTYVVYDHAIGAFLNVRLRGDGGEYVRVYGTITAKSDVYSDDMSCLFLKKQDEAQLVAPGTEIALSKQLVAVPCNGVLLVKVVLAGLAASELIFPAKQEGVVDPPQVVGQIEVRVTWKLRCNNYIEAIEDGQVSLPERLRLKV